MYKICFQACFFRFHVISNRFSSDGRNKKPVFVRKNAPNFYFSGRWLGMVVLFLIFSFAADFSFCYLFDACDVLGVAI